MDMTEILDEGVADGKMCKTVYEKSKVLNSEKTISYRREKPVRKQIAKGSGYRVQFENKPFENIMQRLGGDEEIVRNLTQTNNEEDYQDYPETYLFQQSSLAADDCTQTFMRYSIRESQAKIENCIEER